MLMMVFIIFVYTVSAVHLRSKDHVSSNNALRDQVSIEESKLKKNVGKSVFRFRTKHDLSSEKSKEDEKKNFIQTMFKEKFTHYMTGPHGQEMENEMKAIIEY